MSKVNLDVLKTAKHYTFYRLDTTEIIYGDLVRLLRMRFKMTPSVFASVIGVSEKTLYKWEIGKKKIPTIATNLIYLLYLHPELMNDLYLVEES